MNVVPSKRDALDTHGFHYLVLEPDRDGTIQGQYLEWGFVSQDKDESMSKEEHRLLKKLNSLKLEVIRIKEDLAILPDLERQISQLQNQLGLLAL